LIDREPKIRVGIIDSAFRIDGFFRGTYTLNGGKRLTGGFSASSLKDRIDFQTLEGGFKGSASEFVCSPDEGASFVLEGVAFGIGFHWEQRENQTFPGSLRLVLRSDGSMAVINEVTLEEYLASVISSEMSAGNSLELLKAHAITSRSWLVAMLEREKEVPRPGSPLPHPRGTGPDTVLRWYSRENHDLYDVCADDHCQRYQGMARIASPRVLEAVDLTRGMLLVHGNEVCDARFSKSCGGIGEDFANVWEDRKISYLGTFSDSETPFPPLSTEADAERWILSRPAAFCNVRDPLVLREILPSFDQNTQDFFRWQVRYEREELEGFIRRKGGVDVGMLRDLVPDGRGPSGRIFRLRIVGSWRTVTVGKELEIRKWLSPTHLYSSCFFVRREGVKDGFPTAFILDGAGWGHGVGLCQIGAAAMALKGFSATEILRHYFAGTEVRKLYG
jgi:peptidoglycan hydrolase-like amidase